VIGMEIALLTVLGGLSTALITWLIIVVRHYIVEARHKDQIRADGIRGVAEQLGLTYLPDGEALLISELARFKLFSCGRTRKVSNTLYGRTEDVEVAIFDYQYVTGFGQYTRFRRQSVVTFCSPHLTLPDFVLSPESDFHRIAKIFGYTDIDFNSHPTFSQAFLLRGSDEARIREVFQDDVLDCFERSRVVSFCIEGCGHRLLFYRKGVRVMPDKIRSFMDEGFYRGYMVFRYR